MTFQEELQALITKHGLADVTVSYKQTITLSAQPTPPHVPAPAPLDHVDEETDLARAYTTGRIGTVS